MRTSLITQITRAIVLVNFLLWSVVAWGEAGRSSVFAPLSLPDYKQNYNFDLLVREAKVIEYESASGLALSLPEEPMPFADTSRSDWRGITKDTTYFLGYQLFIIGAIYTMPARLSGWSDETKSDFSIQQYKDNVSQLVWDKDDWWLNYVLHPYWGGTYYTRAQERGFGPMGSFLYAATLSSLYEFGAEAFFEEPSVQDFFVTPVAGYFVGKYFMKIRTHIRKKERSEPLNGTDKFLLVITDPIGAMNAKVEEWFGKNSDVSLRPMMGSQFQIRDIELDRTVQANYTGTPVFGMQITLRW